MTLSLTEAPCSELVGPGVLSSVSFDRAARPDCFWGFLVSMALPLRLRGLRHHELEQDTANAQSIQAAPSD